MSASVMWGMAIGRHIDVCSLVFPFPKLRQEKDGRSGLLTPGITKILSSSHIASIIYLRYLTSRGSTLFSYLNRISTQKLLKIFACHEHIQGRQT